MEHPLTDMIERVDPAAQPPAPAPAVRRRLVLHAVLFLALGAMLGASATAVLVHRGAPRYQPAALAADAKAPATFVPPTGTSSSGPAAPPVEISIPSIRVTSPLIGLRLNNDGTLQVPTDYARAGWFSDGPAPGDAGQPAIIAGHVDSKSGPAVFYRLRDLKPGSEIFVRRADGTTARFVIDKLADYSKTTFPTEKVYAPTARPEMRLITCSGGFDAASGHYLNNLVAFAHAETGAANG
ncbi:MAG: class F sortase [Mycobacteriales bacterium]